MNSAAPILSRLPLFADVSPETLTRFEHRMRRRECAPRTEIVREGSSDDSALLVLSGRVEVRRKDPESGIEMALLTRKPRTASVVALEATTCGIIEQSDFDQLLTEHQGVLIEPVVVTEDDFKRFMSATYPLAQGDGGPPQPPPRSPGSAPAARQAAAVDLLESSVVSVDI